jgi:hypothetical protein
LINLVRAIADPALSDHRADRNSIQPVYMLSKALALSPASQPLAVLLFAVQPEARGDAEHTLQLQRGLRREWGLALDDLVDDLLRVTCSAGQIGLI